MPRTPPDPESPRQRRLALITPIVRELDRLTDDGQARVMTFIEGLLKDGEAATTELQVMKSITHKLGAADPDDRTRVVRTLREDYGAPNGARAVNSPPAFEHRGDALRGSSSTT